MAPPQLSPHLAAFVARLASDGLAVGSHQAPSGQPKTLQTTGGLPYHVVYQIAGGYIDGPTAKPDDDAYLIWQVTSVGSSGEHAMWATDKARAVLAGFVLTVSGRALGPLRLDFASGGATRDDDLAPPVFYAVERFAAWSHPS